MVRHEGQGVAVHEPQMRFRLPASRRQPLLAAEPMQLFGLIGMITDLPVSADLGEGFGALPEACAATVRMACEAGLVGGSVEDATGDERVPIYELSHAVERIKAAAEAARDGQFLLTARAENFLWGKPDIGDTIRRLQAFSEAGADVLYAPGLPDIEAIRSVCRAVDKPVNVVMGLRGKSYTVAELSEAGVRRISVGGSFARAAFGALARAAHEVRSSGTFTYAQHAIPDADISLLEAGGVPAGFYWMRMPTLSSALDVRPADMLARDVNWFASAG